MHFSLFVLLVVVFSMPALDGMLALAAFLSGAGVVINSATALSALSVSMQLDCTGGLSSYRFDTSIVMRYNLMSSLCRCCLRVHHLF